MFINKKKKNGRRDQTRTPAQAPTRAFSYYSAGLGQDRGQSSKPAPIKRRRKLVWVRHIPSYIAAVLILASVVFSMTLTSNPSVVIDDAGSSNPTLRGDEVYLNSIRDRLAGSFWNKSKLTINSTSLEEQIKKDFPELRDVSVKIPLVSRRPVVVLEPANPAAILTPKGAIPYVLDDQGRAIMPATQLKAPLDLIQINDESGLEVGLGQQVVPASTIDFITTFIRQLGAKGVSVSTVTLPAIANQLNVAITGKPYIIKCNLDNDPSLQAGTYLAARRSFAHHGTSPQAYVDVRIDERVYYK